MRNERWISFVEESDNMRNCKEQSYTEHKEIMESIYQQIRFSDAIDYWAAHFAKDEIDVAISNARHLDPHRQEIENRVWQRYFPEDGRFLDLACGAGFFTRRLSKALRGKGTIIGIDISYSALRYAKLRDNSFSFLNADGRVLPFDMASFEGVLAISTLEHVRENLPVLRECARILKPNGIFYLCVHKQSVDPFVFPTLFSKFKRLVGRGLRRTGLFPKADSSLSSSYSRPLSEVRRTLTEDFQTAGFELLERGPLLHSFQWGFYKKYLPWVVPSLIRLGKYLNRLPFSYCKNLEYWVWRKKDDDLFNPNC